MPLYVNKNDQKLEDWALRFFCSKSDIFYGIDWTQNNNSDTSIWDFTGTDGDMEIHLDVKIRDINSTDFPDYFLSKEKYDDSLNNQCFMLYVFRGDRKMLLFDLNSCTFKKVENQTIHHRRANKQMTSVVYKIPSNESICEVDIPRK